MIAHVLFNLMINELGKRDKMLVLFFVATSLIKSKSSNVIKLYGKILELFTPKTRLSATIIDNFMVLVFVFLS